LITTEEAQDYPTSTTSAGTSPAAPPVALREAPAVLHTEADAEKPLADRIAHSIATASSDRTLKKILARLDVLVAEDQITGNQWSALTDAANARLASITGEVVHG
jgi:hypothetical protein